MSTKKYLKPRARKRAAIHTDGKIEVPKSVPKPELIAERVRRIQAKWQEFLAYIDTRMHNRWIFRGCPSTEFKCVPSVGRVENFSPISEERVFRAFQRAARLHISLPEATDWDWLAVAQHHGLPTRLLDWTSNPLVACFFSVSGAPVETDAIVYAHSLDDREIISTSDSCDPFSIQSVGFLLPTALAPRIASQRGLFSAHPQPNRAWEPGALTENAFVIPAEARATFQRKLFRLGVDAGHIYPGLDGLCGVLGWRYTQRIGIGAGML